MKTKLDAVMQLMYEARSDKRYSQTAVDRVTRACKSLELTKEETISVLGHLDICGLDGIPYFRDITITIGKEKLKRTD